MKKLFKFYRFEATVLTAMLLTALWLILGA